MGLPGIPQPVFLGIQVSSHYGFLLLVFFFALFTFIFSRRLVNSPFGRVLKAIREDEVFALSLGKNVAGFKIIVFIVGASLAAIAGSLYAYYITYIVRVSDIIVVMDEGRKVAEGNHDDILNDPKVLEAYLNMGSVPPKFRVLLPNQAF